MSVVAERVFPSGASVSLVLVDGYDGVLICQDGFKDCLPAETFMLENIQEPRLNVNLCLAAELNGKPFEMRLRKAD